MKYCKVAVLVLALFLAASLLPACETQAPIPTQTTTTKYSAYLDIETTGFKAATDDLIIIGIYLVKPNQPEFIQLVDEEISATRLELIFKDIDTLYTYNGIKFDLPFIKKKLKLDLNRYCRHIDLMELCHEQNLYGGLKKVEETLSISRKTDIDGREVAKSWRRYKKDGDKQTLNILLEYNKEDTINLSKLKQELAKRKK